MKKLICFLFAFLFLLSAAGCGEKPIDTTWMETPDTTVSEVGISDTEALYSGALNADKMAISSVRHFPIYKFDTLEDLTQFKDSLKKPESLSYKHDEIPSFNEATAKYDEAFFSENTLLLGDAALTEVSDREESGIQQMAPWQNGYYCITEEGLTHRRL